MGIYVLLIYAVLSARSRVQATLRSYSDSASNETFYSFVAAERLSKPATPPKTSHKHIPTHLHIPNRPTSHLICFEFNVVASTYSKCLKKKN